MNQYSGTFSGLAFSNSLTNGPDGWEFFSVVIVKDRAIAFEARPAQKETFYTSIHTGGEWQHWIGNKLYSPQTFRRPSQSQHHLLFL